MVIHRTPLLVAVFALACGGESNGTSPQEPAAPSFERSPIVFGAFDPPGTFFITLSDREPQQINGNYDFYPLSLSPARRRLLQNTTDDTGAPRALTEIYEIAARGPRLGSFPARGPFVGWMDESTLLFETRDGFETTKLDGVVRGGFALPADVARDFNDYQAELSPDRSRLALVAMRGEDGVGFEASVMVVDAESGLELARWITDIRAAPHWLDDAAIVATTGAGVHRFELGAAEPIGPMEIGFEACSARPAGGRLLLGEQVVRGDYSTCDELWFADIDGRNATRIEGFPPVAFSPDDQRMLVLDLDGLVVSRPDGSEAERLDLPYPSSPTW
jgi:hypothetical protein